MRKYTIGIICEYGIQCKLLLEECCDGEHTYEPTNITKGGYSYIFSTPRPEVYLDSSQYN